MKVILLSDIYKHGVAGEIVDVAAGFARNYLIPKKLAVIASPEEMRRAAKLREQAEARRLAYENRLNELGRQIDGTELVFFRRAASTGKLFGSVTTTDMQEQLMEVTGVDINRRRISIQALRDVGVHTVPVRLGTDVSPALRVVVVGEEQRDLYLRQQQAVKEGKLEAVQFDESGRVVNQKPAKPEAQPEAEAIPAAPEAEVPAAEDAVATPELPQA